MKSAIKWTVVIVIGLCALALFWMGPDRLYGISRSKQITGTVEKIQPHGSSTSEVPSEFIVEVSAADGEIFTFISADPKWGVMSKGDRVKAWLYPAAPWSTESGSFRDARLIAKLAKLPDDARRSEIASTAEQSAPSGANTVVLAPQTSAPAEASRSSSPALPSTQPTASNKPTAQSGLLLTFGALGLPSTLLGLRRRYRAFSLLEGTSKR